MGQLLGLVFVGLIGSLPWIAPSKSRFGFSVFFALFYGLISAVAIYDVTVGGSALKACIPVAATAYMVWGSLRIKRRLGAKKP